MIGLAIMAYVDVETAIRGVDVLPEKQHVTLMFTRKTIDIGAARAVVEQNLPFTAKVTGTEVFGSGRPCMVLTLRSEVAFRIHDALKTLGARHDYPVLALHLTTSYDSDAMIDAPLGHVFSFNRCRIKEVQS